MTIAVIEPTRGSSSDEASLLWIRDELVARGHAVSAIPVPPLSSEPIRQLDAYEHCLALDLSEFDLVISSCAPGWLVPHKRHVVVSSGDMLSRRPSVSTIDAPLSDLDVLDSPGELLASARELLGRTDLEDPTAMSDGAFVSWLAQRLENMLLAGSAITRLVTPSEFSARRFEELGWDRPIMVVPPTPSGRPGTGAVPPRNICFAESHFDSGDRLSIAIDAFESIDDIHAELRIAGDGPQRAAIQSATHDRRIRFLGSIDEASRQLELNAASSVLVLGIGEGWSPLGAAAMRAGVPLVATEDAGGVTELVEHGLNGVVVEPTAERMSWGMRHIASTPRTRWQLGLQARRRSAELSSAPLVDEIEDLLSPSPRPRALALSIYPVDPMVGGGQRRARFLLRAMADRCDVTVLVNTSQHRRPRRRLVEAGLVQIEIPKSDAQLAAELDMFYAMDKMPVDDLTAAKLSAASPAFETELARLLETSDLVIGTQPFLVPCIPNTDVPIVHDSQNVESVLKASVLPDSEGGRWLLANATEAELDACRRASFLTACTDDDLKALKATSLPHSLPGLVVGNGVDTSAIPYKSPAEQQRSRAELLALAGRSGNDDRPIALFIGSWHPPNIEAARLILDVAEQRPDWLFVLAGSHTSEFAGEPLPSNTLLIATFAESLLWPLLAGADVALNPMRSGGGSNLKLFDYLAVGTEIVTTPVGARGLTDPERFVTVAEATVDGFSKAIDVSNQAQNTREGQARRQAGRALVEGEFDWRVLGDRWVSGILAALDLTGGTLRRRTRLDREPVLSSMDPPSTDPVVATMQLLGQQARTTEPSPQEVSMDPALRERLKRANDNRNIGRELPAGARFTAPKKALIRVGRALTNEQVIYNAAMVEAVEQLAVSMRSLEVEQRELRQSVETLTAENRALQRRLEVLE